MAEKRLIEIAFPLEQVSLDAVHEKNVRHGHISTLHIWPARRPLAACRAALIAALTPDPGDTRERQAIYERMAGSVVEVVTQERNGDRMVEKRKRETRGGILHWKRAQETDLDWFRARIREAYGGRAPRVLDPFAGGGAIPLEAMRLGCEATAVDINPVAWFILTCTLDYPSRLASQTEMLPGFSVRDCEFMTAFLKDKGFRGRALSRQLEQLGLCDAGDSAPDLFHEGPTMDADFSWHVRAWGRWVLKEARRRLSDRYPTYAAFQPLKPGGEPFEPRSLALLEPDEDGNVDVQSLNSEFDAALLDDPRNPRWVAKPTVAYLWARTVRCKGCRATIPLLKTLWLANKDGKCVALTMTPNADHSGIVFGIQNDLPSSDGSTARRRTSDQRIDGGTMSRSGVSCPLCPTIMTMEDLRLDGRVGRLGEVMTAVVVDGPNGKEYRLPTDRERQVARVENADLDQLYEEVPFGLLEELTPSEESLGMRIPRYGFDTWRTLFTNRQLLALGTFVQEIRRLPEALTDWPEPWREAISVYAACALSKFTDYSSAVCSWINSRETLGHTFARFAFPMVWDYCEVNPLSNTTGGFVTSVEWLGRVCGNLQDATLNAPTPIVLNRSAASTETTVAADDGFDLICTDPPYYDAIPYSDLMDFFYVWLRRVLRGLTPELDAAFGSQLGPKWNAEENDGELIDEAARFDGDRQASKRNYEDGMARAFSRFHAALRDDGRLIVVFANKSPAAWETLVSALIRAGFVVDGSWPIRTERESRQRSLSSAALASSIWIVCRKRPPARVGWDAAVLAEMRENISQQLRDFWDAGIRGPDFVWAATGPALEAFSKYPVVKKADAADAQMTVSEFLREVRRFVVDFVVGRVLTQDGDTEATSGLDDITTYYLLHRNDFGHQEAPIGACILYAISCNLSDRDLTDRHAILSRSNRKSSDESDEDGPSSDGDTRTTEDSGGTGSKVTLKRWNRRRGKSLGARAPDGSQPPLIDQVHRLMHLWRAGDEAKVSAYLDDHGLKRHPLFARVLQALIELADAGSEERSLLESLSNHISTRSDTRPSGQLAL